MTADLVAFLRARLSEDEEMLWRFSDWSKARVLRQVEAGRAIVELHSGDNDAPCQSYAGNYVTEPCPTIRALAAVYRDHEDYREEWAL